MSLNALKAHPLSVATIAFRNHFPVLNHFLMLIDYIKPIFVFALELQGVCVIMVMRLDES